MNNDLNNNHGSMNSNKYIANRRYPHQNKFYQESYIKDKGILDMQSKGNRTNYLDSDNDKRPSNQQDLFISKGLSRYPTNYAAGPNPYNADIIKGYYVGAKDEDGYNNHYQIPLNENYEEIDDEQQRNNYYRQNIQNGGDEIDDEIGNESEDEEEVENGNEYNDESPHNYNEQYNEYIGDGIVRNNLPNYSPNQNGQNVLYYRKKYLGKYNPNYGPENEDEDQYIMESPSKKYNLTNYNVQPYKRRHILGNLADSASSEAYAKKNSQISPYTDNNSRIYVKPKTQYNNMNNGISTEERGIESKKESPNNVAKNGAYLKKPFHYPDYEDNEITHYNRINNYDEDSINVVEPPLYNNAYNDRNKGGKVDLKNFGIRKNREKKNEEEEENEMDKEMKEKEKNATKIQSFWRASSTRRIMKLYHDLDEFIYLLSKVHFNHFSDNFYFFINQLYNVYKANTLDNNQLDSLDEEKEENEDENEDEKIEENNKKKKNYEELLNDYNDLQKKYNELMKNKFDKSSTKKSLLNNDIVSVPGETTIGTIKTDNNKLKFKHPNNSTNNINNNDNLTFSNDYNDDVEINHKDYERHFYTPNQEDEDSFNDNSKDKRFSYSSIHSEENSKYFDNEQPKGATSSKRSMGLKNKGKSKIASLSLNKKKDRILSYSPSFENDKQSRENSRKKNINSESMNEHKINNISVIIPKHEEEFGIIKNIEDKNYIDDKPKDIEEKLYGKYVSNFSKYLFIVKNNKINLKNEEELKTRLNCFDNELIFPENENILELKAPKKSDEKKIKDILDDEKLLNKLKNKIFKNNNEKLIKNYKASFSIENEPINILEKINNEIEQNINNLEIIQNNHRNFNPSKLDFESNELFLGDPKSLKQKKKLKKIVPIFEKEINILNIPNKNLDKLQVFSVEKTLPTYNIDGEKNIFTINNIIQKAEQKPISFNKENMIIDNVFNNEIHMDESKIDAIKEKPTEKEKVIEKEIIYLPMKESKFKRLRRSKRTKETYFTIKKDLIKKDNENILDNENKEKEKEKYDTKKELKKTNENNFEIKNEYYYIETNDNQIPEIIEKQIKETIIINKPSKEFNKFTGNKMILSNETNFDIKADENKIKNIGEEYQYRDINSNRIRGGNKKHKKIINKNDEFMIIGKKKNWEDLNPIAIDEFSYRNEFESENEMEENEYNENEENEGFQDNQNIYSDRKNEIINDKEQSDKKGFIESKQNVIELEGMIINKEDKELQIDIKQLQITTKKIFKKEQILSRKKFLNNEISSSDTFSMYGSPNKNINNDIEKQEIKYVDNKKELILVKENISELFYKKIKTNTKENETETKPLNHFYEIIPVLNSEFNIKNKKIKMKEEATEITDELNNSLFDNKYSYNKKEIILENIRNENIMFKCKKKKMKESETEIDDELKNMEPNKNKKKMIEESTNPREENNYIIKSDNFDIFTSYKDIKDKEQKQIVLEESKINEINLESRIRSFPKLDIYNNLYETFNRKEKEKIEFEKIQNESIILEPKKDNSELLEKGKEEDKKYYIEKNQISIKSKVKNKNLPENAAPKNNEEEIFRNLNELIIYKSEEYNILGKDKEIEEVKEEKEKKKVKTVESETQVDDNLINDNQESSIPLLNDDENNIKIDDEKKEKPSKLRGKKDIKENINVIESNQLLIEGLEKEKIELEEEKMEEVNYESTKKNKEDNKMFSNLDINKCDEQFLSGKEKEKQILENIKNDNIIINGKEREALENIQKDSILINGKEKLPFENIQKDSIIINGKEKEEKILENIANESIALYGKENTIETKIFENVKNESIIIKPNKRKGTEIGTQIDNDLNSNLVDSNNDAFTYESIKPTKKEEKQPLNIKEKEEKREFNKDSILVCYSENFAIKLKEDYELDELNVPLNNLSKKFNKLLNSDNDEETPQLNTNMINNLEESIEKRIEIIGNPSLSKIDDNNFQEKQKLNDEEYHMDDKKDIEPNLTKQFINNIVQDRLEKEKQKTMDQTKNKLIQVFKIIKLKNALGKNLKNKKIFMDKLKEIKKIKDKKNLLCSVNAINHNYLSKKNKKVEEYTDTDNLDKIYDKIYQKIKGTHLDIVKNKNIEIVNNEKDKKMKLEKIDLDKETNNQFTILRKKKKKSNDIETEITDELNKIELIQNDKFSFLTLPKEKAAQKKHKKTKGHRKNISMPLVPIEQFIEAKESDLNISAISKDTVDKEVQIEPIKEFKITTKKVVKKEIMTKKKFLDIKNYNIDSISIISEEINEEVDKDKLRSKQKKVDTMEAATQTPKLRPPNKAAQKVVFHEIKTIIKKEQKEQKPLNKHEIFHTSDFILIANKNVNKTIKEKINEGIEENEESKDIEPYKIGLFENLLKAYYNKRIDTLKLLFWIKWKYIATEKLDRNIKLKKLIMKYPSIFSMKLLESFNKIIDIKGLNMIIKNTINKRTFKLLKKVNFNKDNIHLNEAQLKSKLQIALNRFKSVLKKYYGKYIFSQYKKK